MERELSSRREPERALEVIQHGNSQSDEIEQRVLAPVDGGIAAWRLVAVAFVFEALFWGTSEYHISICD